ncbi:hypothetical protein LTR36_002381 [Oleoguttula mirabilis]|uniref:Ubiquitin-like protease family profile domain-containing protein n=1 Tax=Oleoguttula mirabilis TaxID=1507867 RepID=A0AAV9JLM3_9PEZI|nr:hypothetical protein LTR36_002381 [Oleoguttula mirabilis]
MSDREGTGRRRTRAAVREGEATPPELVELPRSTRIRRRGNEREASATTSTAEANGNLSGGPAAPRPEEPLAPSTQGTGAIATAGQDNGTATDQDDDTGTEQNNASATEQTNGAGDPPATGDGDATQGAKHDRQDDDGNEEPPPQRPRLDSGAEQQVEQQQQAPRNPSRELADNLVRWEEEQRQSTEPYDPVVRGAMLWQDIAFQAIASVSEAVVQTGGATFSLLDTSRTNVHGTAPGAQTVARPGNEVLYPVHRGRGRGGHLALYVVRANEAASGEAATTFRVECHDSSRGTRAVAHGARAFADARLQLENNGWTGPNTGPSNANRNLIQGDITLAPSVVYQTAGWNCGFHTVFNAWAYALGVQTADAGVRLGLQFDTHSVQIVNLALRGLMDAATIEAFFLCYGFIAPEQRVPLNRRFDNTIPFPTGEEYTLHVARVRLEEGLALRRANGAPDLPLLDPMLGTIGRSYLEQDVPHLSLLSTRALEDLYELAMEEVARLAVDPLASNPTDLSEEQQMALAMHNSLQTGGENAGHTNGSTTEHPINTGENSPPAARTGQGNVQQASTTTPPPPNAGGPQPGATSTQPPQPLGSTAPTWTPALHSAMERSRRLLQDRYTRERRAQLPRLPRNATQRPATTTALPAGSSAETAEENPVRQRLSTLLETAINLHAQYGEIGRDIARLQHDAGAESLSLALEGAQQQSADASTVRAAVAAREADLARVQALITQTGALIAAEDAQQAERQRTSANNADQGPTSTTAPSAGSSAQTTGGTLSQQAGGQPGEPGAPDPGARDDDGDEADLAESLSDHRATAGRLLASRAEAEDLLARRLQHAGDEPTAAIAIADHEAFLVTLDELTETNNAMMHTLEADIARIAAANARTAAAEAGVLQVRQQSMLVLHERLRLLGTSLLDNLPGATEPQLQDMDVLLAETRSGINLELGRRAAQAEMATLTAWRRQQDPAAGLLPDAPPTLDVGRVLARPEEAGDSALRDTTAFLRENGAGEWEGVQRLGDELRSRFTDSRTSGDSNDRRAGDDERDNIELESVTHGGVTFGVAMPAAAWRRREARYRRAGTEGDITIADRIRDDLAAAEQANTTAPNPAAPATQPEQPPATRPPWMPAPRSREETIAELEAQNQRHRAPRAAYRSPSCSSADDSATAATATARVGEAGAEPNPNPSPQLTGFAGMRARFRRDGQIPGTPEFAEREAARVADVMRAAREMVGEAGDTDLPDYDSESDHLDAGAPAAGSAGTPLLDSDEENGSDRDSLFGEVRRQPRGGGGGATDEDEDENGGEGEGGGNGDGEEGGQGNGEQGGRGE